MAAKLRRLILVFLLCLVTIYFIQNYSTIQNTVPDMENVSLTFWQERLCNIYKRPVFGSLPLKVIHRKNNPVTSDPENIFLTETGCESRPNYRAWCSVESWAAQNPRGKVYYVTSSPYVEDPIGLVTTLLEAHKNLQIPLLNFTDIFLQTPLWEFFSTFRWTETPKWSAVWLSDTLRVALAWTYGGLYSDTDIVCMKDTFQLKNFVGLEDAGVVNNAHFHGYPHNPFFEKVMMDIIKNFKPKEYSSGGPQRFTGVMKDLCGASQLEIRSGQQYGKCLNMTILPPEAFSPYSFRISKTLTESGSWNKLKQFLNESYAIHFFNKMTRDSVVAIGDQSVYDVAASKFCPITYKFASAHSYIF